MANFNLYSASCALLLLLMTLNWRTSTGVPVRSLSAERCEQCSSLYKNLLENISGLVDNKVLCYGITSKKAVVKSSADTVMACAPALSQTSGCMMQRNSSFSESDCLRNIMKDLAHYSAAFQLYVNLPDLRSPEEEAALLRPTLGIIQSLRENCSLRPDGENNSSEDDAAQMWNDTTYNNRQELCKMIRGFYARTITINRAMGYISSGDHRN